MRIAWQASICVDHSLGGADRPGVRSDLANRQLRSTTCNLVQAYVTTLFSAASFFLGVTA